MILETIVVGPMEVNCYILARGKNTQAVIIDPGAEERKINNVLKKHSLTPGIVINTHGHYDHIGCDEKFGVPVYVHPDDAAMLRDPKLNLSGFFAIPYKVAAEIKTLREGEAVEADGIALKVLHIPGHTRGGIALVLLEPEHGVVFTGDTLFCQGIGRSDLDGGDAELLARSIRDKLFVLPDATRVYPGHGPSSTIGEEKQSNPYIS